MTQRECECKDSHQRRKKMITTAGHCNARGSQRTKSQQIKYLHLRVHNKRKHKRTLLYTLASIQTTICSPNNCSFSVFTIRNKSSSPAKDKNPRSRTAFLHKTRRQQQNYFQHSFRDNSIKFSNPKLDCSFRRHHLTRAAACRCFRHHFHRC